MEQHRMILGTVDTAKCVVEKEVTDAVASLVIEPAIVTDQLPCTAETDGDEIAQTLVVGASGKIGIEPGRDETQMGVRLGRQTVAEKIRHGPIAIAVIGEVVTAQHIEYPEPEELAVGFADGESLSVYSGEVTLVATFARGTFARQSQIEGSITAQACNHEMCLPPSEFPISLDVSPYADETQEDAANARE